MHAELRRSRALSAASLARVAELLEQHAGLNFPPQRWPDLERAILAAGAELYADKGRRWIGELASAQLSAREIETIVCHATVGETYFFRDPALFEAVQRLVLAQLVRTRGEPERSLCVWSAGCCTGEEAYSLAMSLERTLPVECYEKVSVIASDINPRFLARAQSGVYGDWSFRAAPAWVKHYCRACGDNRFEVDPAVRARVRFFTLNLAQGPYPEFPGRDGGLDIIICRNVLMYFEARKARETILRLRHCLREGGWLFVSPVEMSDGRFPGFETVAFSGVTGYRRIEAVREQPSPVEVPASASTWAPVPMHEEPPARQPTLPAGRPEAETAAQAARRLADEGKLDEALESCDLAIAEDRLNEAHHYMRAVILRELGETDRAASALQRALYLAPDFVMAQLTLGHLRVSQHRVEEALRHFAAAQHYASRMPPEARIAFTDGVEAGGFVQLVAAVRASLSRSIREGTPMSPPACSEGPPLRWQN